MPTTIISSAKSARRQQPPPPNPPGDSRVPPPNPPGAAAAFLRQTQAGPLIEGSTVLKLNPVGLHYVHSRLDALSEIDTLLAGTPVDYLRAYISDLGDHRALDQLRRILQLLTSLKVVSVLPSPARDPTPLSLLPFARLKVMELRGCDVLIWEDY